MRRRTFARDLMGTLMVFVLLVVITFGFILGEKALEAFKSH
ncbi:MAG TPA: hypothetical protein VN193_05565 [Candidatus Angelobacter sp.]|jgi:hypothetical protein|nr:hypothetical protein [Candidatus Angelobacter sp.]